MEQPPSEAQVPATIHVQEPVPVPLSAIAAPAVSQPPQPTLQQLQLSRLSAAAQGRLSVGGSNVPSGAHSSQPSTSQPAFNSSQPSVPQSGFAVKMRPDTANHTPRSSRSTAEQYGVVGRQASAERLPSTSTSSGLGSNMGSGIGSGMGSGSGSLFKETSMQWVINFKDLVGAADAGCSY